MILFLVGRNFLQMYTETTIIIEVIYKSIL